MENRRAAMIKAIIVSLFLLAGLGILIHFGVKLLE
jgi:small neutral amino acid transporter SnatA (MarC family)